MHIVKSDSGTPREGSTFSGKTTLNTLLGRQVEGGLSLTLVTFEDGSVTNWHKHPGEQILYVLEGRCRTGNETESWEIGPGDIVYIPPGERHWHGALEGESMTHISVTNVGPPTWYEESAP